jgi:hypothetical protein
MRTKSFDGNKHRALTDWKRANGDTERHDKYALPGFASPAEYERVMSRDHLVETAGLFGDNAWSQYC